MRASSKILKLGPAALLAAGLFVHNAQAATQAVTLNVLNASATLLTPFAAGDNLRLNTLVTTEVGALSQAITFTIGAGVDSFTGEAAWEVSTDAGTAPRLTGVNLDLFDAGNTLVASDTFAGSLASFGLSTLGGAIGPGTYKLVATGTGVRDSSLDVTLSFANTAVPAPGAFGLALTGVGALALRARRRRGRA